MLTRHWPAALAATLAFCKPATALELTSASLMPGETFPAAQVYSGFGCTGENLSPELSWRDVPPDTRSFALTLYDPDAPTGSGWWHWIVINLPSDARSMSKGAGRIDGSALPSSARQLRNDFGSNSYGGPCPPAGSSPHHYVFTLYALKVSELQLPPDTSAAMAGYLINANALASTRMVVSYGR